VFGGALPRDYWLLLQHINRQVLPNNKFFPDIKELFSDMALKDGTANMTPSNVPYVILYHLVQIMLRILSLSISFRLDFYILSNKWHY
jgi:hypothetical protein